MYIIIINADIIQTAIFNKIWQVFLKSCGGKLKTHVHNGNTLTWDFFICLIYTCNPVFQKPIFVFPCFSLSLILPVISD